MFSIFQWNVSDVLLELTFLERVRWLSKIPYVIPLVFFSLFRPRFSQCRRTTEGEAEKRRCCDGIFIISSVTGVGASSRIQRGFVSLSRPAEWHVRTHTRAAPLQVQDPGMCLKWCSPAGAVRTWGTQQKHELHRDQRSEVIFLLSCEISSLDIETHTHTHTHTRAFQYKSWTGAASVSQSGYEEKLYAKAWTPLYARTWSYANLISCIVFWNVSECNS